jgi:MHS family proline/betaine transporter-like MFS transporter
MKKTASKKPTKSLRKVALAGMIGNGLEWYDYALYGTFAPIIGKLFFPSTSDAISIIKTFGVFAAGFIMRPIGAILFGYIGDRFGRKISLALSILLMAIPTAFIGLLPTYAQIGIAAPILLTILRLTQGIALGGEFSGSITYIVEHSGKERRNFAGSLSVISLVSGMLLGSIASTIFAYFLSNEQLMSWGWRLPFLIGFLIGLIGLAVRSVLTESPEYEEAKRGNQLAEKPIRELFRKNWRAILAGSGLYMAVTVPFYMLTVFMNSFLSQFLHYSLSDALLLLTITMIVLLIFMPVSARLSDHFGNRIVLTISAFMLMISAIPIFWFITQDNFMYTLIGEVFFATILAFYIAPIPTALVDLFPTRVRYTGMAVACNLCATFFGGTTPIVSAKLLQVTGNNMVLAYYIMVSCAISLITLAILRRHNR